MVEFQSTLPHGERLPFLAHSLRYFSFQSTLPHGERHVVLIVYISPGAFQSTLPHGERPDSIAGMYTEISVSIHAPARGATSNLLTEL